MKCILCSGYSNKFGIYEKRKYYRCNNCRAVFMDPKDYISLDEEKERYEQHNNDVKDKRYQSFVSDVVEEVTKDWDKDSFGLDFGAGTGPVITKLLKDKDYKTKLYDPFFHDNDELLKLKYDYIVSCEVIEHFHNPYDEFKKLFNLLKSGGNLYCKTELFKDSIDFDKWYYKTDPTHVFFYHEDTIRWIKENFEFQKFTIKNRVIIFDK